MIKLIKRNKVGVGCFNWFRNDTTGEVVAVEIPQSEYEKMNGIDGFANNPKLEGHTWMSSSSGTIKVDSPSGFLGNGEYIEQDEKLMVRNKNGMTYMVEKELVDKEGNIDEKWL